MKQILLFTALLFALINCYAQSSNAEAKAAYMLAEEEFAAGKYAASIFYLEVAATKLKGANAKIMYLKVMALSELVKTNSDSLQSLNNAISAFEKTPDFSTFNEEKQLEVIKLKMKLGREAKFGREISAIEAMVYLKMQIIGWQLGNTLEETKKAHPDYFLKAAKTQLNKEIETYSSDRKDVNAIFTKEKLTALSKYLLFMSYDNASYSAGNNLYSDFKDYLGTSATETITVQPVQNTGVKWYTTSSSTKTISWKDDSIVVVAVLYLKSEKVRKDSKYESTFMISVSLLN